MFSLKKFTNYIQGRAIEILLITFIIEHTIYILKKYIK